ncbi:MAG: hypothetical protein ACP5XB_25895 [Isosphaeraceae bacterium]
MPIAPAHRVETPVVTEARRLLLTRDVMIGDGLREHAFTDHIPVHNVRTTLWRTRPVAEYSVNRRNHFFQINPDSPLAVFLWQIDIAMKEDLANQGFHIATLQSRQSRVSVWRPDARARQVGEREESSSSGSDPITAAFEPNAYGAYLDSPLGGAAVFPLSTGLEARMAAPGRGNLDISLSAAAAPRKRGETAQARLLIVGIPRRCVLTEHWSSSAEVVERFYREFGLNGDQPGYTLSLDQGKETSHRYLLRIDGTSAACFSGRLEGTLISSLPIAVAGLNDRWSAYLFDRTLKQARPIGVFEGTAWATISVAGRADLFVGHPILVDRPELFVQLTQSSESSWALEIHNPTDAAVTTRMRANPAFDPLRGQDLSAEAVTIPAGSSVLRRVGRG